MSEDLSKNTEFKQYLKDGTEIITIDKTWCSPTCLFNISGDFENRCSKFPATEKDLDWYDGPLRRIACMKETGDYES